MALPLLFIGAAVATGAVGGTKTIKAVSDNSKAGQINEIANQSIENARDELDRQRKEVGAALEALGKEKLTILNRNVTDFVTTFEKIKNVDFQSSIGLEELKNLHIDQNTFQELKELGNFALGVAGGAAAGAVGGALTAVGAYSAAMTFASASTGTAISALSGAAATNATLAFFGGGSLASGGLGMAGGMYVLGGLVEVHLLQSREAHGVCRAGTDAGGTPGGHVADGLRHIEVVLEIHDDEFQGELPLVDHPDFSVLEPHRFDVRGGTVAHSCLHGVTLLTGVL